MKTSPLIFVALTISSVTTLAAAECKESDDDKFFTGGQLSGEENHIQDCAWLQSSVPFLRLMMCDITESFTDPNDVEILYPPANEVCRKTCDSCPSKKESPRPSFFDYSPQEHSNDSPQECVENGSDRFFLGFNNNGSPLPLSSCADLVKASYIPNAVVVICARTKSYMDENTGTMYPPANEVCLVTCDRCPSEDDNVVGSDDSRISMGSSPDEPKPPTPRPSSVLTSKIPYERFHFVPTISPSSKPTESFDMRNPTLMMNSTNSPTLSTKTKNSSTKLPTFSTKSPRSRPLDFPSMALSSSPFSAPMKIPNSVQSNHPSMVSSSSSSRSPTNASTNTPTNKPINTSHNEATNLPVTTLSNTLTLTSVPSNASTKVPTNVPTNASPNEPTNESSTTPSNILTRAPTSSPSYFTSKNKISSVSDSSKVPTLRQFNIAANTPSFTPSNEPRNFQLPTPSSVRLRVNKQGRGKKNVRAKKESKSAKDTKGRTGGIRGKKQRKGKAN